MNVSEVITRVQRIFGDESGVQINQNDIIRWINDCQEEMVIDNEGLLETAVTTDVIQGQTDYSFPSDLSVLRSLQYKGYAIKRMSFQEFDVYLNGYNAQPNPYGEGLPSIYMVWNNTIKLFPPPNESVTAGLKIYYCKHPVPVVTAADALTVPIQYHKAIVDYCLQQAYELDEDQAKVQMKKQEYEQKMLKLNDRNKWTSQETYPVITTLPQDDDYGGNYGWWGGGWW